MRRGSQRRDFAPKKRPAQARSQVTFDAIVEAATWLLPRLGYAGTSTNHVAKRAGVNVASLYEYFPGKDAIVAQVAERMVERVFAQLELGIARVLAAHPADGVRTWIEVIYETVEREKALVAVFQYQVPYTNQLAPILALGARLVEFSLELRERAGPRAGADLSAPALQLLINLVTSTILQIVELPPRDPNRRALLEELIVRVAAWLRPLRS